MDQYLGPYDLAAGASLTLTMITEPGAGTAIFVWDDSGNLALDVVYSTPHTITVDLPSGATNLYIILDWEFNGLSADTFQVTTSGCGAGCDALTYIPPQAVMGQFVMDAPVYWAPDSASTTGVTIQAGKTYRVTGQDASGQYRQILLQCQLVWVPAQSVGPDADAVWQGQALPTTVVK